MQYWFTSDLHLGHANIIAYCNRPFKDVDEMNSELIRRWNERVKPEDTVIHNGDFCFKSSGNTGNGQKTKAQTWEQYLNGKIIFIRGNHDRKNSVKTRIHNVVLRINGHFVNIVHDPLYADINHEINLTGHVHEKWEIKRFKHGYSFTDCINVGVDVWNYYPVTYEEIKARYDKWLKSW